MNKAQSIRNKIGKLTPGKVFSAKSLNLDGTATTRKILSRLEKKGAIQRVDGRQGFYFIPKQGVFGTVKPPRGVLVRALLTDENKGYRSGLSLYNKLGLTTQVPGNITIACNMFPRTTTVGGVEVQYRKARAPITKDNIPLLQYLDVFMDIKNIPDTTPGKIVKQMKEKLKGLEKSDVKRMIKLSDYYPKRVQALLGALLENLCGVEAAKPLKKVTQSGSIYKLGIKECELPNRAKWNIR
ncbi:MAG TPA: hypothetical protein DCL41_04315 [Bdellovibrionales bacterium]|nr:hypothetical protein [Bdellovibrionales bacterium]|tara:strand:+ start:205 stop:924 length:720 start_codon:yes stop_codon:yes gene_type:complete